MWVRGCRYCAILFVAAAVIWTAGRACGIGFVLGKTKEELRLKYDVTVQDHGTGRVTVVLTLEDEGRLKPLDEVQLVIPAQEKNEDGGHWMDLVVSVEMRKTADGKRVGRVHIRKDFADRAQIQLNTHTLDGKKDPLTRLHHVIPVAKYVRNTAEPQADPPGAKPSSEAKAEDGNAAMIRPFVVQGTVTDEAKHPLAGVEVTANCGLGTLMRSGTTRTDSDGRYALRFSGGFAIARNKKAPLGVGVQAATIAPRLTGWYESNLHRQGNLLMAEKELAEEAKSERGYSGVVLPHDPYRLDFVMAKGATVEGRLVNEFGRPIAGETVSLDGEELPPSSSALRSAETDSDGRFRFDGVPLHRKWFFSLRVHGIRHELTTDVVEFDKPQQSSCELILKSTSTPTGAVQLDLLLEKTTS